MLEDRDRRLGLERAASATLSELEPVDLATLAPAVIVKLQHDNSGVRSSACGMLAELEAGDISKHAPALLPKLEDGDISARAQHVSCSESWTPLSSRRTHRW